MTFSWRDPWHVAAVLLGLAVDAAIWAYVILEVWK